MAAPPVQAGRATATKATDPSGRRACYDAAMLFKAATLDAIAQGRVTLAFRRWRKPTVRTGGTMITRVGQLAIESVTVVSVDDISEAEAQAAGYSLPDLVGLLDGAGDVHRIAFRLAGDDPRRALRADDADAALDDVGRRLARLDRVRPWTQSVLQMIASYPGVRAGDLAPRVGRAKADFKADVRKLKALGLTESLETGYRLSPRGRAMLGRLAGAAPGG